MTKKIENGNQISCNETGLQGYIDASYADLVEAFGEPASHGDGYKVDAEWILKIDGVLATIYNYKNGPNYEGSSGMAVENIRDWHVGGHGPDALAAVEAVLA